MIRDVAAAATEPCAEAAASELLAGGGTAVDAVLAGYLAASGARAAVLLGPVVAIVVGGGAGARSFDGRCCQPGRGAARPRGFVEGEAIPLAARAAVPRGPALVALLHQVHGRARLSELVSAGVAEATRSGAKERATLLRALGSGGVMALRRAGAVEALLLAGGAAVGGLLTRDDLAESAPSDEPARQVPTAAGDAFLAAFPAGQGAPAGDAPLACSVEVVVAGDARGQLAALAYVGEGEGVAVPELGVELSAVAEPVRRGVERVRPGTPRPAPAPIGVVDRAEGVRVALGLSGAWELPSALLSAIASAPAFGALLDAPSVRAASPAGRLVGVAGGRAGASSLRA